MGEEAGGEEEDDFEDFGGGENAGAFEGEKTDEVMDGLGEEVNGGEDDEEVRIEGDAFTDGRDGKHEGSGALEGVGDPACVSVGGGGVETFPGFVPEVEEEEAAGHCELEDGTGPA